MLVVFCLHVAERTNGRTDELTGLAAEFGESELAQNPAVPHPVGNTYLLGGPLETSTAEIGQSPLSSYNKLHCIASSHSIQIHLEAREQLARVSKAFTSSWSVLPRHACSES
eukprot:COSAG06_NODE_23189_length_700_cov_0.848586_1_plen_112_part_00